MAVQPQPLRSYLKEHDVGEPALLAMIRFLVAKKSHSQADRDTEYLWKKHYDALLYLLHEGRRHKDTLARLPSVSQQKGLLEKSKQLLLTAAKLETTLAEVAAIF